MMPIVCDRDSGQSLQTAPLPHHPACGTSVATERLTQSETTERNAGVVMLKDIHWMWSSHSPPTPHQPSI